MSFVSLKAYPLFNPNEAFVFGGAEVDLYLLATELAKDSAFDVSCVVGDYGQDAREERGGVQLIRASDVRRGKKQLSAPFRIWSALCRANGDVYMNEACAFETAEVALFCKLRKRVFVYRTAHSREVDGSYVSQRRVLGWWVRWALKGASALIVQNDEDVDQVRRNLGREAEVIRNACRAVENSSVKKSGVLWVGRSKHVKRPELFLKLAVAFPGQAFTMICQRGTGDKAYKGLREAAAQLENLTFLSRVPYGEIGSYFENAALYVNTSDSEGFPNTFVQATGAGTPILSLSINPDHFLQRHGCGICAQGDWDTFVQEAERLINSEDAAEYGRRGVDYAEQYHAIGTIIQRYKKLFTELSS